MSKLFLDLENDVSMNIEASVLAEMIMTNHSNTLEDIVGFIGNLYEGCDEGHDFDSLLDFTRQVVQMVPSEERKEFITSLHADEIIERIGDDISTQEDLED